MAPSATRSADSALARTCAGYTPDDYPGEEEWEARALVERSDAFKCPSVAYQLAGAKKIQQASARRCAGLA